MNQEQPCRLDEINGASFLVCQEHYENRVHRGVTLRDEIVPKNECVLCKKNQEKEWWEYRKRTRVTSYSNESWYEPHDVEKIIAEATRRGELKAWKEMLEEIKVIIKDHQIKYIGNHHDAEGLTKAYHLAYKEMRKNAEDRITDLESL